MSDFRLRLLKINYNTYSRIVQNNSYVYGKHEFTHHLLERGNFKRGEIMITWSLLTFGVNASLNLYIIITIRCPAILCVVYKNAILSTVCISTTKSRECGQRPTRPLAEMMRSGF